MTLPSYLTLSRHNIYYYRFPIPKDLHPERKSSFVRLSLGTPNRREAMVIANMLTYHAETTLKALRHSNMNYGQIRETIKDRLAELVADGQTNRLKAGAMNKNERGSAETWLDQFQRYDVEEYYSGDIVVSQSERKIAELFPNLSLTDEQHEQFIKEFIRQYPVALEAILAYDKNPNDIAFDRKSDIHDPASKTPLGELIEKFVAAQLRGNKWTEHTEGERRRGLNLLTEYLGSNFPVEKLDKKKAREVRDIINALPVRLKQNKKTKSLSLVEATKVEGIDKISPKTANEYIGSCSTFGNWLVDEGYIDKNPFSKMKTDIVDRGDKRRAFTPEEITMILSELETDKIKNSRKTFRYWGVLIGLYTGARLEEICQLHLSDIEENDGILCININDDDDKNVKSKDSKRIIPLHSYILNKGFLEHIEKLKRNNQERLFPELNYSPKHGYGRALGNWFNTKFLVELGIKEEGVVFHSLRHTVATGLGETAANDSLQKRILGHSMANDITAGYDKSKRLGLMQEALEKLPY